MRQLTLAIGTILLSGPADLVGQVTNEDVARHGVGCYSLADAGPEEWDYNGWDGDPSGLPASPVTLELRLTELSPQPRVPEGTDRFPFREAVAVAENGDRLPYLGGWRALGTNALLGLPDSATYILFSLNDRAGTFSGWITHSPTRPDGPAPMKQVVMTRVGCIPQPPGGRPTAGWVAGLDSIVARVGPLPGDGTGFEQAGFRPYPGLHGRVPTP